jgi:hypothetical protein
VRILASALRSGTGQSRTLARSSVLSGLFATALLTVTLIVYARFLGTGFAATDSLPLIDTSRFRTPAEAGALFARPVMFGTRFTMGEVVYRPFVSLTFGLDYVAWGLNAVGYHLTNLGLHLAGVLSVWFLLTTLGLRSWSSLAGAAMFALHPVVVASVPVIARRDSLVPVTAFVAGAGLLLAAEQARHVRRVVLLLAALLLVAIALLSKESAFAAVLMLPVLFVSARPKASVGCRHTLSRTWILLPFLTLGGVLFVIRLVVLGGLGGGSGADLLAIDLNKYGQILGAFTRNLAWALAWLAPSTREIWWRLGVLSLVGLALTIVWLPRQQAGLAAAGTLWIAGFALFCMGLKIATVAWLAYFALVGVALVFAAGLEGSVLRIRTSVVAPGWRTVLPKAMSILLLVALAFYAATSLWASPAARDYYQWQLAGDVTRRFTQALNECVARAPEASRVNLQALPTTLEDGRFETSLLGVTLLEDYTVGSALRLAFPDRDLAVHVSTTETLRAGADTLQFACAMLPPDGVQLTTSY